MTSRGARDDRHYDNISNDFTYNKFTYNDNKYNT
jgi:hypothetical protein